MSSDTVLLRPRNHSLNDVRAVIPDSCYKRSTARAMLVLLQAVSLHVAPLVGLALTDRWWALIILWPLAGLAVSGLFVLGHDASHGALVDSRRQNRLIAQLCMTPSAHVEAAWDLGHNRVHHGFTTRQGFDFVWHPLTPDDYRSLGRLARLRHRLEWSWFGAGAYFLRVVWWEKMWRFKAAGKHRRAIVRDKITLGSALAVVVGGAAVLGAFTGGWIGAMWMPVKLLVVPFLLFVQIIGWTVYVHHVSPDIRWWTRREWSQYKGQMESTTILRVPRVLNRLWFHNIFVHVPHHVDARIPFHQLPKAAAAIAAAYPETVRSLRLSLRQYLRATKACKLYDFEAGCWLPYSAARA
ncbi:MAG: omega-6 fatty acid desaturase (delta-12 desaturase) [Acidimicrobiaceae bacterium]|nr:MAG: omega-6 fatty acid desaturase (delta-12 desaturase) [Acidimicrobiaceae bacterium]